MASQVGYRAERTRLQSGERFPLIVKAATGLPCAWACRYSLYRHRTKSISTAKRELEGVCLLYDWADRHGIDLDERIGTGNLFSAQEVEALTEALRISRKAPRILRNQPVARVVKANTHGDYVRSINHYLTWRVSHVTTAMATADPRIPAISGRLKEVKAQLKSSVSSNPQADRLGLTEEQQIFLLQAVHPESSINPFHPETRHRNYALLLLLFELGTRRAEPLTLKGQHLQLNGASPRVIIEPRPDDPDEMRADPPLVKTLGRTLPVSPMLARTLDIYVSQHRRALRNAKKQVYIFLESVEGHAMSLASVSDVFEVLRRRFPDELPLDFSPHILRHTWNDRFTAAAKGVGLEEKFLEVVRNYLMGWDKNSKQAARYSRREIERQAGLLMLALQDQMGKLLS